MNEMLKRFMSKDLILAYAYRGSGVVLVFVLNIVLARFYGAELSGDYYVLYNFLALVSSVVFLGLSYVIVHFITPYYGKNGEPEKGNLLFTISLVTVTVMILVVGIIIVLLKNQISEYLFDDASYTTTILIVAIAIIPYVFIMIFTELFKALGKPNLSIFAANIICNILLIILLIIFQIKDLKCIFYWFILAYTLSSVFLLIGFRKLYSSKGVKLLGFGKIKSIYIENRNLCREYRKENLTLSLVAISNVLLNVFDSFVIRHQLTSVDVALYSVANKVVSFGSIILTTINSLIGYQIADLSYKKDQKGLSELLVKYTKIMIPLSFLYYVFALIFALAIPYVFGGEYTGSVNLCYLLAIGQFISIITGPCSYFVIMTGHAKKYTQITIVAALISVVTNLILVPVLGIYGSVVSNILTLSYKNIHTFLFAKKTVGLKALDFLKSRR